ncbi:uncharacterized protein LOC18443690 [Amborella trichopoda]|uniref:BRISC and BRCA1-A complex member 1 n=1 Tax=Amborella trichopoda TaxID=13333 RepID=U5CQD9_AMBTC|nr:uncharacterized protein LOC18443690 [Amborella trichopoda]ERN15401.1 hypothetical protein AMTR_s00036p00203550 [Amborella trichopoda]|eukprot:XP_006853934.1 uncharacterized protein LOC18443690 [Amborella trichopoda]
MEGGFVAGERGGGGGRYSLQPRVSMDEDILFCIDVDREAHSEMKASSSKSTQNHHPPITRLDAIKQSLILFIHCKLTMNPNHRFAFAALSHSASCIRKEFSGDVDAAMASISSLTADSLYIRADLTQLFKMAAHEAKRSRSQSRILRVILIYCRSSVVPEFHWSENQKLFTFDAMYLHEKPSRDNCPQKVYDALVDALERVSEYEGYIVESGVGLARVLFRHMCVLLSHPQQRCLQDDLDIPKSLTKKAPANAETTGREDEGNPANN